MPYKHKADQAAAAKRHYERDTAKYKARALKHNRQHRARIRALLSEAKERPCLDCGVRYPPCVMDFDHVRGAKEFNVGSSTWMAVEAVEAEIAKCEVVCANCHRIRTNRRITVA